MGKAQTGQPGLFETLETRTAVVPEAVSMTVLPLMQALLTGIILAQRPAATNTKDEAAS